MPADASHTDQHPGRTAGLVQAGHALTHADDLDGLLRAIESMLAPGGLVAIDFHHALGLARGQFDVLSHAHRSYLSLSSVERLLARHSLVVVAAELTPEFGGTVRLAGRRAGLTATTSSPHRRSSNASSRQSVRLACTSRPATRDLPAQIASGQRRPQGFLERARNEGSIVAGYGAAARGTVLLNVAGIAPEQLRFVVDRSPDKQGRLLPGCRIPIHAPGEIERVRPDDILILPWPLAPEIERQLAGARVLGRQVPRRDAALRVPRMTVGHPFRFHRSDAVAGSPARTLA